MSSAGAAESPGRQTPRVSVIIPAHNTAPFIAETLDSVFGQTFRDFEVIVINDGSPDTAELEVALRPYRSRIHYIKQENQGLPGARNAGVRLAASDLLAFLDSDDIWMPDYLSAQLEFLDSHPRVHASIADALLFWSGGQTAVWRMLKEGIGPVLSFEQMLKRKGGQLPSATVVRRQRVFQVGMFDEQLRIGEDVEFCLRLCCPDGTIGYIGRVLVKYRQRPGSLTDDPRGRKWSAAEIYALRRLGEKLNLTKAQRELLEKEINAAVAALGLGDAYHHICEHEFGSAVRCLRLANAYYRDPRITVASVCLDAFPRLTGSLLEWRLKRRSGHQTRKNDAGLVGMEQSSTMPIRKKLG
jgi:glycosyltransferase involved in cell wall biosynthesis